MSRVLPSSSIARIEDEHVIEGIRIPPALDTTTSVNFVLTQEPGKLKPKDLKAAIERNRAEKEQRAEQQRKLREEGGGAGLLDLRGILSEERLNSSTGDAFQRQLREMAFLADVDDVEKQEVEKAFRVSHDFFGSDLLSERDIQTVYRQRAVAAYHKKRSEWRDIQSRNHTATYAPIHATVKAGTDAQTAREMMKILSPHYDTNRVDVWSKRMNTLRRFISLVSTFLVQKRVQDRMEKVRALLRSHNAATKEDVRELIEVLTLKKQAVPVKDSTDATANEVSDPTYHDKQRPESVSVMVFAEPNGILMNRKRNEALIEEAEQRAANGESEITPNMARRILFPSCNPDQSGSSNLHEIKTHDLRSAISFDDRTFFQLKVQPEFVALEYNPLEVPSVPLYFSTCEATLLRSGAHEEAILRPAADSNVSDNDIAKWVDTVDTCPPIEILMKPVDLEEQPDSSLEKSKMAPEWMNTARDEWSDESVNFFDAVPKYRTFVPPGPRRCEIDEDWNLRPDAEQLIFERDTSLRSSWCSKPGFQSCNIYLLGNLESRNRDLESRIIGPVLSDFYLPDTDRHASGLTCFAQDHLRGTVEWDHEVAPLQRRQDQADYLTDSESDEEDEELLLELKPSLDRVRKILSAPPPPPVEEPPAGKGAKGGKSKSEPKKEVPAPPTTATMDTDAFSVLDEEQKKEEQVELLRDRKTLDLESTWLKSRKSNFDSIAARMRAVSGQSRCLVQALRVQMPFHSYEDDVYKLMETRMPEVSNHHVEFSARQASSTLLSSPDRQSHANPSSFASPLKEL